MQNTSPTYRERLAPSLWMLVAAAVVAPMAALVFAPFDGTLALGAGVIVAAVLLALLIGLSPVVAVDGTTLRVGRAHINARWLGVPTALEGEEARLARTTHLDVRAWLLIRGGIEGLVIVPNTDPDDPATAWYVSSRTPERLAAAIEAARYAAQSTQTKPAADSSAT